MSGGLSMLEVLENLNTFIDANSLDEIEVGEEGHLILHHIDNEQDDYWIAAGVDEQTLDVVKQTFASVLGHLKHYLTNKAKEHEDPAQSVEKMGDIMVLVGEAANHLTKFGELFHSRVTELKEYKELQHFYQKALLRGSIKKISKKELHDIYEVLGTHILDNIEVVKEDKLYELFYMKNEEGHPFYTHELVKKIKLACDFGFYAKMLFTHDSLVQIKNWEDRYLHLISKQILMNSHKKIAYFYKHASAFAQVPFVVSLNNCIIALMLAANARNLIRQFSPKGCFLYFSDFQHFLRELLHSDDYQKFLVYPTQEPFFEHCLELVQDLCYQIFSVDLENQELKQGIAELTEISSISDKKFSNVLENCYLNLEKKLKEHPNGPVFKALDLLRQEESIAFDPLLQSNLSDVESVIKDENREIVLLRLACPTMQDEIVKAFVIDEFKAYLRESIHRNRDSRLLLMNFQDKTSWVEHARSKALEELANRGEFSDFFFLVTLNKDTDFYHQIGEYEDLSDAKNFIDFLEEQICEEGGGCSFPRIIDNKSLHSFIQKISKLIHEYFFSTQDLLSKDDKKNFIELLYAFIELKLIDWIKPSAVLLTSKDGLDVTATTSFALSLLLHYGNNSSLTQQEKEQLIFRLFGHTLMLRERTIHQDRFNRVLQLLRLLEQHNNYWSKFSSFFSFDATT